MSMRVRVPIVGPPKRFTSRGAGAAWLDLKRAAKDVLTARGLGAALEEGVTTQDLVEADAVPHVARRLGSQAVAEVAAELRIAALSDADADVEWEATVEAQHRRPDNG